jgi:hypothetical protein
VVPGRANIALGVVVRPVPDRARNHDDEILTTIRTA